MGADFVSVGGEKVIGCPCEGLEKVRKGRSWTTGEEETPRDEAEEAEEVNQRSMPHPLMEYPGSQPANGMLMGL